MAALSEVLLIRIGIAAAWVLLPVILIFFAIREWKKNSGIEPRQRMISIAVAFLIVANWICFILLFAMGLIGGFGTHIVTTRMANWFVVGSLLLSAAALFSKIARGKLTLACVLILALWIGSEVVA